MCFSLGQVLGINSLAFSLGQVLGLLCNPAESIRKLTNKFTNKAEANLGTVFMRNLLKTHTDFLIWRPADAKVGDFGGI